MHDIAGYMLCSLELNMQALVHVYVCQCLFFFAGLSVGALFRHLLSLPIASSRVRMCASVCVNGSLFRSC